MGGERIVVHTGSCAKLSRGQALALAMESSGGRLMRSTPEGLDSVRICPEVMGKVNQLGTVDEVLTLCSLDERMLPASISVISTPAPSAGSEASPITRRLEAIENRLGLSRLREYHAHFSKIQYTENGGEKCHLTFADTHYGPDFEPVAELTAQKGCHPVIICESAGTQAEDARTMRQIYESFLQSKGKDEPI